METRYSTYQQVCADALAVQDACNLSGVLNSMLDAVRFLRNEGKGNGDIHSDPAIMLFADKIASLTGTQGNSHYYGAIYAAVERGANG